MGAHLYYPPSSKSRLMIAFGVIWMLIGYGVWDGANNTVEGAWHFWIPAWIRALLWVVPGLYTIYAGVVRRHKDLAVRSLLIMPIVRVTSYFWAWVVWLIPGAPFGYSEGWYQACFQGALIFAVFTLASVPSSPPDPRRGGDD